MSKKATDQLYFKAAGGPGKILSHISKDRCGRRIIYPLVHLKRSSNFSDSRYEFRLIRFVIQMFLGFNLCKDKKDDHVFYDAFDDILYSVACFLLHSSTFSTK